MTDSDPDISAPSAELLRLRPAVPRDDVLEDVARSLTDIAEMDSPPRWRVVDRQERRRSTVFRIDAVSGRTVVPIYYKTEHVAPRGDEVTTRKELRRRRTALETEARLAPALTSALKAEGVAFDRPLCVRPDILTAVRLGVPGSPLGRSLWYALPGRRRRSTRLFYSIGRLARRIEDVGRSLGPPLSDDECRVRMTSELERSSQAMSPDDIRAVADLIDRLFAAGGVAENTLWTHGDLSPTNLLVHRGRVGIIDFGWVPHFAGRDVWHFIFRISSGDSIYPRWQRHLTRTVLDGYGAAFDTPAWRLAHLQRVLRALRKNQEPLRRWGRNALRQIDFDA
jgi:Ser/Thr protein kinase RdoA (MazF antagonist)